MSIETFAKEQAISDAKEQAMSDPKSKNSDIYYVITDIDTCDCSVMKFANLGNALSWYLSFDNAILTQKLNITLQVENLQGKTVIIVKDQKNVD